MVPKTTDPLAKFIRTGEGILVFAFNLALLIVPIVSNALTPAQSAKWATIIDGVAVISRTGLKMVATAQAGQGAAPAKAAAAAVAAAQIAAAATAQIAAPATVQIAAPGQQGTVGTGTDGANGSAAAAGQLGVVVPQLAQTVGTGVADVEQLVADAEEFADAPSAAQSEPTQYAVSAPSTAGLIGSTSQPNSPFMAQVGG
jgi:hypothetical protein